jgi:hypothetical protein
MVSGSELHPTRSVASEGTAPVDGAGVAPVASVGAGTSAEVAGEPGVAEPGTGVAELPHAARTIVAATAATAPRHPIVRLIEPSSSDPVGGPPSRAPVRPGGGPAASAISLRA